MFRPAEGLVAWIRPSFLDRSFLFQDRSQIRLGEHESLAARWADAIISMLNEEFRERVSDEAERSMTYLAEELDKAVSVELRQVIHRLIETQIQTIMLTNIRKQFVFRVIDPAVVPDDDYYVSPRPVLYAFLGLVFGGFLGLCIAALRAAIRAGASARTVAHGR